LSILAEFHFHFEIVLTWATIVLAVLAVVVVVAVVVTVTVSIFDKVCFKSASGVQRWRLPVRRFLDGRLLSDRRIVVGVADDEEGPTVDGGGVGWGGT
jgi:hypothetical protein